MPIPIFTSAEMEEALRAARGPVLDAIIGVSHQIIELRLQVSNLGLAMRTAPAPVAPAPVAGAITRQQVTLAFQLYATRFSLEAARQLLSNAQPGATRISDVPDANLGVLHAAVQTAMQAG